MDNHKGFADGNKMNDKPMMKCRNHKLILLHCKSCGVYQTGTIYPHNMSKEQWRKWVACEAMKGLLSNPSFQELPSMKSIVRSEERRVGKECRSRWSPYH